MTTNLTGQEQKTTLEGAWWTSLLSFGMKAVGTIASQFLPMTMTDQAGEKLTTFKPSYVGPIVITKTQVPGGNMTVMAKNEKDFPVILTITSSSSNGTPNIKEFIFDPKEELDITDWFDSNLTGTLSWSKFDTFQKFMEKGQTITLGRTMLSVKDWGQGSDIKMFHDGLKLTRFDDNNFFTLTSEAKSGELKHSYYDVQIMVVDGYGSTYDFGPFDVASVAPAVVDYPDELDHIQPIPRVTIWASCEEKKYNEIISSPHK